MSNPTWILVPAFIIAFAVMWYFAVKNVNHMSGMAQPVNAGMGKFIQESKWGSAMVNGAMMSGCAKLAEYENGWLLRGMSLFGGGQLWLPRDQVKLGPPYKFGLFRQLACDLECGENHLSLYTRLAEIVA